MLVRARFRRSIGCTDLESMALSAPSSLFLEDAVTYVLCRRNSLMDSHDGHDSIRALVCHGDVQECVLAGET